MYILWLNHPYNPSLNGTKQDVSRSTAEQAIDFKQAEYAKRPLYGSREYLAERLAISAAVTGPSPYDTPVSVVKGVRWEIGKSYYGKPVIQRLSGSEIGQCEFGAIPDECPADVRKQYEGEVKAYTARAEAMEKERARALESGARFAQ